MEEQHWESFYQIQSTQPSPPSQFSAFIASEYIKRSQVFDFGCGNGRDSFFLANFALSVCGIDGSSEAIKICSGKRLNQDTSAVQFINSKIEVAGLYDILLALRDETAPLLIYSRFFLHAITDEQEESFFSLANKLCTNKADRIALEFRTVRDRDLPKQTAKHFRRYIDPVNVITRAVAKGFTVEYFVEGFGFAKYLADDAYVARIILGRNKDEPVGSGS